MGKFRFLIALTLSGVLVSAPVPPSFPDPCGQIFDAVTGAPIAGVRIEVHRNVFPDGTPEVEHLESDSLGAYCYYLFPDDRVLFSRLGYHSKESGWPQGLSPTGEHTGCPEDFVDVYLVPLEVP